MFTLDLAIVTELEIKRMQTLELLNVIFVTELYEHTLSNLCVNTANS